MATATAAPELTLSETASVSAAAAAATVRSRFPDFVVNEPGEQAFEPEFCRARQRVLTYLIKLNRALENSVWDLADTLLVKFCEALGDYLAVGHQQTFALSNPAAHQYVAVAATSREIMQFTDLYLSESNRVDALVLTAAHEQLEALALTLETRFELEDALRLGLND